MGKCRFPGTYRLQFVVRDDYDVGGGRSTCTTARADSVVSCQCATTPSVVATRTIYESLYLCRGDNRRFQAVNISVDVTELDGFKLPDVQLRQFPHRHQYSCLLVRSVVPQQLAAQNALSAQCAHNVQMPSGAPPTLVVLRGREWLHCRRY